MSIRTKDLREYLRRTQGAENPAAAAKPKRSGMNKTEARFGALLNVRKAAGEFDQVGFEALTFRLGFDCRFTPDWTCWFPNGGIVCYEVKGRTGHKWYAKEDAMVKLRAASSMYPKVKFILVWPDGEGWETKEIQQ